MAVTEEQQRLRMASGLKPSATVEAGKIEAELQTVMADAVATRTELTGLALWQQAETIFRGLRAVSDHCKRTANNLERDLMELERLLGHMPIRK